MISVRIVAVHGIIRDFVTSLNTVVKECLEISNAFKEIFILWQPSTSDDALPTARTGSHI